MLDLGIDLIVRNSDIEGIIIKWIYYKLGATNFKIVYPILIMVYLVLTTVLQEILIRKK